MYVYERERGKFNFMPYFKHVLIPKCVYQAARRENRSTQRNGGTGSHFLNLCERVASRHCCFTPGKKRTW